MAALPQAHGLSQHQMQYRSDLFGGEREIFVCTKLGGFLYILHLLGVARVVWNSSIRAIFLNRSNNLITNRTIEAATKYWQRPQKPGRVKYRKSRGPAQPQ
jgi:hypothetical protein